jgi:hypothetical protein
LQGEGAQIDDGTQCVGEAFGLLGRECDGEAASSTRGVGPQEYRVRHSHTELGKR